MAQILLFATPRRWLAAAIAGGAVLLVIPAAQAAKLLEYNFSQTIAGPVTDGQAAGSTPFGSAELFDDVTGTDGSFQFNTWNGSAGPTANYALEGQSLPAKPQPNTPFWDGAGLGANGDIFIRATDANLELTGPFSVIARIYHPPGDNRTPNGPNPNQTVFGGANTGANGAWNVFIDGANNNRLEVHMGSEASGSSEAMRNGFGGNGPGIPFNKWTDIGIAFDGDADADAGNNDEANETLKVYINGLHDVRTITGSAAFATNVGGVFDAIFGDGFGNTPYVGQYERFVIWDEALTDQQFAEQMIPEPTSGLLIVTAGLMSLFVGRRRRN